MKKYLAASVLFFTVAAYGAAVIFQGPYVKTLKDDLKLGDTARIITGTADPQSSATEAEPGSIYIRNNGGVGTVLFKTDTGSSTNWSLLPSAAVVTEIDGNVNDLITLSGEAENSTAHSAFTGTVLSGVTTTRSGLQALGTRVDTNTTHVNGDGSDHQDVADLVTLTGEAANSTAHAAFTGTVLAGVTTTRSGIQALGTQVDTNTTHATGDGSDHQDVADLVTLSGLAANSTSLGTFTGTLLADSLTVKDAIQDVEDYLEATMYRETTGDNLIIFGETPAAFNTASAFYNIVLDPQGAASTLSTGDNNILIGRNAGAALSTTGQNVMIGDQAGASTPGTSGSVIIGHQAGNAASSGANRVMVGWQAGRLNTGVGNVLVGYEAGEHQSGSSISTYNTYLGYQAGKEGKGDYNVMLGYQVGVYGGTGTSVSNILLIDNNDCDYSETGTRCLIEGSMSGTNDRLDIGGELYVADNNDLRLAETDANGTDYIGFKAPASVTTATTFTLPDGDGANGQLLKTNGSATLSWADPIAANGGINLETDPMFQQGQGSWTTYDDGASATPVDFTGGSPTGLTITASATDTSIFADPYDGNLKMAKAAADHQGEGIAKAYTIPNAVQDKGQFYVSGWYTTSTGLTTGDVVFKCYDVTNTALLTQYGLTDDELAGLAANVVGKFNVRVPIESSTASVRCGFHWATTSTSALDISFSGLKIGPDSLVDAPIMTEWETFTPTLSWTTNTTVSSARKRRVGGSLEMIMTISLSGAPDTTTFSLTLPDSLTGLVTTNFMIGSAYLLDLGTSANRVYGMPFMSTSTTIQISATGAGNVTQAVPFTWASGDVMYLHLNVPIAEWANQSGTLSTTEMMNQTVKAIYNLSASSANTSFADITTEVIDFDTKIVDTHNAVTTGASWVFTAPKTGYYLAAASLDWVSVTNMNRSFLRFTGAGVNVNVSDVSATASALNGSHLFYLQKGETLSASAWQDDSTGAARSVDTTDGFTRISIMEIPDLSVYGVYGNYERYQDSSSGLATYSTTAGTWGDLDSRVLPAGTWKVSYTVVWQAVGGAITTADVRIGVSTNSGNSSTGLVYGENYVRAVPDLPNGSSTTQHVIDYVVEADGATTYYLKSYAGGSITNLEAAYAAKWTRLR